MIDKKKQKEKVAGFVGFLVDNGYFGEVSIKFNHGNIIHINLSKGIKVETLDYDELYKIFINKRKPGTFKVSEIAGDALPEGMRIEK